METKKRQIEQTYYVAFDGKNFTDRMECEHYEEIKKGIRKICTNCSGFGKVTKDDDFAGDGKWGSSTGIHYLQEKCEQCNGKGSLELKEVWQ